MLAEVSDFGFADPGGYYLSVLKFHATGTYRVEVRPERFTTHNSLFRLFAKRSWKKINVEKLGGSGINSHMKFPTNVEIPCI